MNIPSIQGNPITEDFFIYSACDSKYFDEFGPALINSIKANSAHKLHLHLYNPTDDQLSFCTNAGVSVTFEYVPLSLFKPAASRWSTVPACSIEKNLYDRTLTAMQKGNDSSITERFQKTYYASARFFRLKEILKSTQTVFAIDVDAVVRQEIPTLPTDKDFYIHYISGRKARYLAGGLYLNATVGAQQFLKEYSTFLKENIEYDTFQWGIDQDVLDRVVPKYNWGDLPIAMIDWEMLSNSIVWTAKGTRKNNQLFINEKTKYIS